MIQTLKKSYGTHLWYEHKLLQVHNGDDEVESFQEGPMHLFISVDLYGGERPNL
jgi:hypothetical protein